MEVKGSNLDFALVVGSALRYGLGRRTYITGVISKFIIDNIKLIPNDQKLVMIRDIKEKKDVILQNEPILFVLKIKVVELQHHP